MLTAVIAALLVLTCGLGYLAAQLYLAHGRTQRYAREQFELRTEAARIEHAGGFAPSQVSVPGLPRQFLNLEEFPTGDSYDPGTKTFAVHRPEAEANLVSSELYLGGWHAPALDIDAPVHLLASSTPGHYHLYIDVPMRWGQYKRLLRALCKAGVISDSYYKIAIAHRATHLRKPGVRKQPAGRYAVRAAR